MKAGFSEKDMTPPPGTQRAGAYRVMHLGEMHDPIKVRAAVFEQDGERVALAGLDICMVSRKTVLSARSEISALTGIKPGNILIAASHTHSGGSLWGLREEELEGAPELIRKLAMDCSPSVDIPYEKQVISAIVSAVVEADKNKKVSSFSFGKGYDSEAVFNRRFRMKNGVSVTHPGKGNADILEAAGPVDPEVIVIGGWEEDGRLAGCVVNYACHGTCYSGMMPSADWIGYMESMIKAKFGQHVVTVFLNGACGDITQVDNISQRKHYSGLEWMDIVGTRIGAEAVKVLISSEKGNVSKLNCISETMTLKKRKSDPAKTEKALEKVNQMIADSTNWNKDEFNWAKERVLADYLYKKSPERDVEIQAIQIGPAVILANPAEYFCSLGLGIKKASKFPFTMVTELANDCIGYVPDEEAFSKTGGGYETRLTSYSNLEITAGTKIKDKSIELSATFTPEAAPGGPQVEEIGDVWSYGNSAPELD